MKLQFHWLPVLLWVLPGAAARSQTTGQKCPVAIERIELSYSHQGGQSKPQLVIRFADHSEKKVSTVTFGLSLLDSEGTPHPYPDDLVYRDGLDPHHWKSFTWDLAPESVDIHRTGEIVVLSEIKFEDATSWKDDGTESCQMTVDYHAR